MTNKVRFLKQQERSSCPVYVIFGASKNWGSHYAQAKRKPQFLSIYIKGMTPPNFFETHEHELLHKALNDVRTSKSDGNWSGDNEHWAIEKVLWAEDDWL